VVIVETDRDTNFAKRPSCPQLEVSLGTLALGLERNPRSVLESEVDVD
jgi:hypothetical protein